MIHADGTGLHELAPGQPVDGKYAPDISPDGTKVAFNSWNNKVQVWEAGIDGGAPRLLTTDCSGVPDACREEEPAYASDGTRIAFVRGGQGTSVIGIRDLASGAVTLLESTRSKDADGVQTQPTWSPDGTQIAFARLKDDPKTDEHVGSHIFIVDSDGTGLHQMPLAEGTPWGDPRLVTRRVADPVQLMADPRFQHRQGADLFRTTRWERSSGAHDHAYRCRGGSVVDARW